MYEKPKNMTTKKSQQENGNWKNLVQGFVVNILEHISEDISHKAKKWFYKLKKRTAGAALMVLGVTFLLTGVAVYANTVFEKVAPGVGYAIVGLVIMLIGYITSRE